LILPVAPAAGALVDSLMPIRVGAHPIGYAGTSGRSLQCLLEKLERTGGYFSMHDLAVNTCGVCAEFLDVAPAPVVADGQEAVVRDLWQDVQFRVRDGLRHGLGIEARDGLVII